MFPQKRRTRLMAFAAASSLLALTAACSGGAGDDEGNDDGTPSGELTVLTWRTDLVEDGTFDEYVETFKAKYPEVTEVNVEGVTDYEGTVKTRMNTDDYGDVLAIPGSVTPDQLPDFFEPLGDQAEMEKEYRWLNDKSFEGTSYGIPVVGNVQGILYNKRIWEEAGITEFPTTSQEFLDDLQAIKDSGAASVAPLYTNYKDSWALSQWEGWRGAVTANPDYVNEMTQTDTPWTEESDSGVIDGTIYDAVAQGLTEADPTTTDWEGSKRMIGVGEVATMVLGSWAIPQMAAAGEAAGADPSDIAYMPTPSQVGLSPLIDGPVPAALEGFMSEVELITMNPAPEGKESLFADIDTASGIVTTDPKYRLSLIDDARSGARTKEQIFDDLNSKWAEGRADAGA